MLLYRLHPLQHTAPAKQPCIPTRNRFALPQTLQKSSSIKVFELMPPATDTEFAGTIKSNKITPAQVASELLNALENDRYEIHVAGTADLYKLFLTSPTEAFNTVNPQRNSN